MLALWSCWVHKMDISIRTQEFCNQHGLASVPVSSLALQYFCAHGSLSVSYKTIRVYLAAIHPHHIKHNLLDPTVDDFLHLVCRGIRQLQGDTQHTRLPITINLMHTLKEQLRQSTYTIYEQWMLWAAFTMAFYGFLRVNKLTSLKNFHLRRPHLHHTTPV